MFRRKKNQSSDERLDLIGRRVVRASASSEAVSEEASAAPFLYARVRAHILLEQERRAAGERWLTMVEIMRRAVPAMGLVAILSLSSFSFVSLHNSSSRGFSLEAFLDPGGADFERVAFADRNTLNNDEVLSAIMDDERETAR
jgi:hypothetical protein